jgi:hypothetical protein
MKLHYFSTGVYHQCQDCYRRLTGLEVFTAELAETNLCLCVNCATKLVSSLQRLLDARQEATLENQG